MKWGVRRAQKKYADKSLHQYNGHQKAAKILKNALDSNFNPSTGMKLDSETRRDFQHEYDRFVETGQQWLQTRKDILNMPISSTTVSDIKNRYRKTASRSKYMFY